MQFIPTRNDDVHIIHTLNVLMLKDQCNDNIWMSSITDKYKGRPKHPELTNMCLAQFASEYRVLSKSEQGSPDVIKLDNDLGFVRKRTRIDFAVVHYARFSPTKNPESILRAFCNYFYHIILTLN